MANARADARKSLALVPGGAGFLGCHLCERLHSEGYRVLCMDNLQYSRIRHRLRLTKAMTLLWVLGLALIVGASWYTWTDTRVDCVAAPMWIGAAAGFTWLSLNRNERKYVLDAILRRRHTLL